MDTEVRKLMYRYGGFGDVTAGNVAPLARPYLFSIFPRSDMESRVSASIPIEIRTFYVGIAAAVALFAMKGGQ